MTEDVRLDRHVRLLTGPYGTVAYTARTVGDAAEVLLEKWPKKAPRGPAHLAAREACIAVLSRVEEARHAREAFEAAAEEANLLLPPEDRRTPIPESTGPTLWRKRKRKLKRDM